MKNKFQEVGEFVKFHVYEIPMLFFWLSPPGCWLNDIIAAWETKK